MWLYIALAFIIYLVGFWFGAHYGIDSCSKNIEDTVILKHVKEFICNTELPDTDKLFVIKQQLESIEI